jgi:hypothetical protein
VAGALLHGGALLAEAVPDSPTRPLLHACGWLAWAGTAALAASAAASETSAAAGETSAAADESSAAAGETSAAAGGSLRAEPPASVPATSLATAALATGAAVGVGALLRLVADGGAADPALVHALSAWPAWLSVLAFVVGPALGEEAFFRGPGLRALAERTGPVASGLASALAFAACHPAHPMAAFTFGAALAALALKTGRAREAMAAHALHNALGLWLIWPASGPVTL